MQLPAHIAETKVNVSIAASCTHPKRHASGRCTSCGFHREPARASSLSAEHLRIFEDFQR